MVEYTFRDFLDTKALIAGVMITLSLVGVTFVAVPVILDDINNPSIPTGSWDISSPTKAANSLNINIEKLLYASVEVFQVEETYPAWGGDSVGHFYSGISRLILFKQLESIQEGDIITPNNPVWEDGTWQLNLERIASSDQVRDINGNLINQQLQTSLAADLEYLNSLSNITDNYLEELEKAQLENNILYWEIDQVYTDGTRFRVRLFEDTIIIRQTTSLGLIRTENLFTIASDPSNPNPPSYKGETGANSLSNYENAINTLLQNILDSN